MMSMNVKDYLKVYDNVLDKKTCKSVVKKLSKSKEWGKHSYYDSLTNTHTNYDRELSISYGLDAQEETALIMDKVWHLIKRYQSELDFPWFQSWAGYSSIRYNRYDVDTIMRLHCDHIHSLFDGTRKGAPILSILGALNDNYEGGELVFWDSEPIQLKAGQIMIFPSNFMYPHEVKTITKGSRYSFVSWTW